MAISVVLSPGIGNGNGSVEQCIKLASRKLVTQQWKKCQHLIVDEVSMVDGQFFEVRLGGVRQWMVGCKE